MLIAHIVFEMIKVNGMILDQYIVIFTSLRENQDQTSDYYYYYDDDYYLHYILFAIYLQ